MRCKDLEAWAEEVQWLNNKYHASMQWIEKRSIERGDIHSYFPNAKSVISLSMNYFTGNINNNVSGKEKIT